MRYWDFVVPFHSSSGFLAWVSSVSFHRGYYFFPASNHFSYCATCENKLILCDHSKYSAVGMRSSSPISGWWPNSSLRFLLLSVHAAFCFFPTHLSCGWVDTHWCAVLTHSPDSPGSDLLIDSAYLTYSWSFDSIWLHSLVACWSSSLVIFRSWSRTIQHLERFLCPCPTEVHTVDFAAHSLLIWWLHIDAYLFL